MKRLTVLPLLLLGACTESAETGEPAPAPSGDTIACAKGEPPAFDEECIVERIGDDVIVHHPDGSFRRLALDANGAGLVAADGAEISSQRIVDEWLILTVGGYSYRFPFTATSDIDG